MDTVTHALLGATLAHVAYAGRRSRLSTRERLLLGGAAAAFPDIDFALFPIDPLAFLAHWHQGPTHSLLLLPLWAALLAGAFCVLTRRRAAFAAAAAVSGLGIASHIVADLITAYGTALFHPLSTQRWSLGWTFLVDPLFVAILVAGLAAGLWTRRRWPAGTALMVLCLYVAGQAWLQQRAVELGRVSAQAQGLAIEPVAALPQPFSPFNWKLVGIDGQRYHEAHLNIVGHRPLVPQWPGLERMHAIAMAYLPPTQLAWQQRHRHGEQPQQAALAEHLWNDPRFAPFRRFAVYPAVSRIESLGGSTCVWYTDLRYDLPALPDTFRYGFCRDGADASWELYRLRYFSERSRQRLSP